MFHKLKAYYFVDDFNINQLFELGKKINIIYRNYKEKKPESTIIKLNNFCKSSKRKLFVSNDIKAAIKHNLNGVYLPAFNRKLAYKNLKTKNNFQIIGSAHTIPEIRIKELQGCDEIFLGPLFHNPKNKYFLDIIRFNKLKLSTKKKINALGGINKTNLKKLGIINVNGFGAISMYKKKAP